MAVFQLGLELARFHGRRLVRVRVWSTASLDVNQLGLGFSTVLLAIYQLGLELASHGQVP